jgi:hypothetical protein
MVAKRSFKPRESKTCRRFVLCSSDSSCFTCSRTATCLVIILADSFCIVYAVGTPPTLCLSDKKNRGKLPACACCVNRSKMVPFLSSFHHLKKNLLYLSQVTESLYSFLSFPTLSDFPVILPSRVSSIQNLLLYQPLSCSALFDQSVALHKLHHQFFPAISAIDYRATSKHPESILHSQSFYIHPLFTSLTSPTPTFSPSLP